MGKRGIPYTEKDVYNRMTQGTALPKSIKKATTSWADRDVEAAGQGTLTIGVPGNPGMQQTITNDQLTDMLHSIVGTELAKLAKLAVETEGMMDRGNQKMVFELGRMHMDIIRHKTAVSLKQDLDAAALTDQELVELVEAYKEKRGIRVRPRANAQDDPGDTE